MSVFKKQGVYWIDNHVNGHRRETSRVCGMSIDRLVHLEAGIQEAHGLNPQRKEAL